MTKLKMISVRSYYLSEFIKKYGIENLTPILESDEEDIINWVNTGLMPRDILSLIEVNFPQEYSDIKI